MSRPANSDCLFVTGGSSAPAADAHLRARHLDLPSAEPSSKRLRQLPIRQSLLAVLSRFDIRKEIRLPQWCVVF